jgi:hypothetical protein
VLGAMQAAMLSCCMRISVHRTHDHVVRSMLMTRLPCTMHGWLGGKQSCGAAVTPSFDACLAELDDNAAEVLVDSRRVKLAKKLGAVLQVGPGSRCLRCFDAHGVAWTLLMGPNSGCRLWCFAKCSHPEPWVASPRRAPLLPCACGSS